MLPEVRYLRRNGPQNNVRIEAGLKIRNTVYLPLCYICILGGKEYLMKAQFFLPSVDGNLQEGKPPINVKFEIPYFTTSGIQVAKY